MHIRICLYVITKYAQAIVVVKSVEIRYFLLIVKQQIISCHNVGQAHAKFINFKNKEIFDAPILQTKFKCSW